MSVQQEHLTAATALTKQDMAAHPAESAKASAAPQLEYNNPGRDSLAMLGAAVGGALLGVFLTLLILAIVNQGSIRFNSQSQIDALQATVVAVDQNVGALAANMDTLVARLEGLQGQADAIPVIQAEVGAAREALVAQQDALTAQQEQLGQVNEAIAVLDVGRQKFDVFTSALSGALAQMSALDAPAVEEAAPMEVVPAEEPQSAAPVEATAAETATETAPVEAAAVEAVLPVAVVAASADVAPDSIQVVYFADANGDGVKDAEEASVVGMSLNLVDADGAVVATAETDEEGMILFAELAAGDYTLTTAEGDVVATVTVAEGAEEGQSVTVPVME